MNNRSVSIIGMITGSLVILLTVSFSIFFSMYMNIMPKEWTGIVNYCNNFDEKLFV